MLSTKTMLVTPNMIQNLQPSQDYTMVVRVATIEINGQLFRLSHDYGVEEAIESAIKQQESKIICYREADNLILNIVKHDKIL